MPPTVGSRPDGVKTSPGRRGFSRQSRRVGGGFPARVAGSPVGGEALLAREREARWNPCCNPPPEGADVSSPSRTRQVVRAVADGTGLTEEEVWTKAGVTVVVVTVLGVLRTVELVLDLVADISDLARE
jgi:hypothetical protein